MYCHPIRCGNCNNLVDFEFKRVGHFSPMTPEEIVELSEQGKGYRSYPSKRFIDMSDGATAETRIENGYAHSTCPRCYHPALIIYSCTRAALDSLIEMAGQEGQGHILGGLSRVAIKAIYPSPKEAEQNPFWPDTLRRQFADAQDLLAEGRSPSIILSTCRTVLELALKELDATPKLALHSRIEALHKRGVITTPIKEWAHEIRFEGNDATHDGKGDEDAAAEYVEFLKMFLNMAFALPARIAEKRATASRLP